MGAKHRAESAASPKTPNVTRIIAGGCGCKGIVQAPGDRRGPGGPDARPPATRSNRLPRPHRYRVRKGSSQPVSPDLSPVIAATTRWLVRAYPGSGGALAVALAGLALPGVAAARKLAAGRLAE